jgi:hypothetical protein
VHIPYPGGAQGRTYFHHVRFVQSLRAHARAAPSVDLFAATVMDLIECPLTRSVVGVCARREDASLESKRVILCQVWSVLNIPVGIPQPVAPVAYPYPYGRVLFGLRGIPVPFTVRCKGWQDHYFVKSGSIWPIITPTIGVKRV